MLLYHSIVLHVNKLVCVLYITVSIGNMGVCVTCAVL